MSEELKPVSRAHDENSSDQFAEFMRSGWANSEQSELEPLEVTTYAFTRRQVLSGAFPNIRLVLPAGNFKVRSNDTDYTFRPHNAFAYYSGVQGADATADSVLVMEPNTSGGHDTTLYIHPRSTRESDAFYKDARYGELWVGRRFTLAEAAKVYQLEVRKIDELESLLRFSKETLTIRGCDSYIDRTISVIQEKPNLKRLYLNSASLKIVTNLGKCSARSMPPHSVLMMSSQPYLQQWIQVVVSELLNRLSSVARGLKAMISGTTQSQLLVRMHVYFIGFVMMEK